MIVEGGAFVLHLLLCAATLGLGETVPLGMHCLYVRGACAVPSTTKSMRRRYAVLEPACIRSLL